MTPPADHPPPPPDPTPPGAEDRSSALPAGDPPGDRHPGDPGADEALAGDGPVDGDVAGAAGGVGPAGVGPAGVGAAGAGEAARAAGEAERAAGEAERAAARRRERAVSGTLAAGLILEGITVLFVPLAVARIDEDGISGTQLILLLLLAAALFTAAGLQRRRFGLVAASVLQLAVVATGVLVPAMYFLGALFAGVWAYLLWVRQEVTRAGTRAAPG